MMPRIPRDAPPPLPGETPWFNGSQLPVQLGVYRRLSCTGLTVYSYWDGAYWLANRRSVDLAAAVGYNDTSLVQWLPWCGLAKPPAQGYGPLPIVAEPAHSAANAPVMQGAAHG